MVYSEHEVNHITVCKYGNAQFSDWFNLKSPLTRGTTIQICLYLSSRMELKPPPIKTTIISDKMKLKKLTDMTSGYTWHGIQVLEATRQTWPIFLEWRFFVTILVKKKKSSNYQIFFSNNLSITTLWVGCRFVMIFKIKYERLLVFSPLLLICWRNL